MQNIDDPNLQPDLPNYPLREQLARVTAPSIGSNVYPAVARQWVGGTTFRDREPCYVTEPNGVALSPATYDCMLVGNYLGLPLYAVTCCATGTFSSSSGGGGGVPTFSALNSGNTSAAYPTALSYDVTLSAATGVLVVDVYFPVVSGIINISVTANGAPMSIVRVAAVGATDAVVQQYAIPLTGPGSVTVVVTTISGTGAGILSNAYFVSGLAANVSDVTASGFGSGGTPDTGSSSPASAAGGVVAAFAFTAPSIGSLAWGGGFGGDSAIYQHAVISAVDYWLVSGHKTIGAGASFDASVSGVTVGDWGGVGVSYR